MGDPAEFEAFIRGRGTHYLRAARAMSPSAPAAEDLFQTAAEDLFQTAAERLLRRWSGRRGLDNPDAYFRQILMNASIDAGRRRLRRPERLVAHVPETAAPTADGDSGAVLVHLAGLPARQRAVVVLRVLEELSTAETARVLDIAEGTVKSALARGLAALRAATDTTAGQT